jgi:hypothetical protein
MTEEDVAELLKESMHTPQGYNRIKQMNLYIEPAWHSENKTPYFLRCDVKNWINLLGGDIPKKEKTWREQLKRMLIMEGLSVQKAENYSRHSFPNEGTSLTDCGTDLGARRRGLARSQSAADESTRTRFATSTTSHARE